MSSRITKTIRSILLNLILATVAFMFLLPMLYLVSTAVKQPGETNSNPGLIPHSFDLTKFPVVWRQAGVLRLGLNSLIITVSTVFLVLFLGSLAGYAFSRLRFYGKNALMLLFLLSMMVPFAGVIVPLFQLNKAIGAINTYGAVVGPYVAFGLPFCILFLRTYFDTLPRELEESARIDGASTFLVYLRILLPLTRPALATVGIFQALGTWNEFLLALLFLTKAELRTLPTGSVYFQAMYQTRFEEMCALLLTITLPVVILFVALQKQFVAGLTAGAVKGA